MIDKWYAVVEQNPNPANDVSLATNFRFITMCIDVRIYVSHVTLFFESEQLIFLFVRVNVQSKIFYFCSNASVSDATSGIRNGSSSGN